LHTFYQPDVSAGHLFVEESRHAVKVLRLESGDEVELTDGKGNLFKARITGPDPRQCEFEIFENISIPKRNFFIHLAISPAKNADRMEWMVEKCVEVGIEKISFLLCKTSERKTINMERLEKVAISAMKQSRQAWLPELVQIMPLESFMKDRREKLKFIAYVDDKNPVYLKHLASPHSDYVVLVGPEGDFTKEELAAATSTGFQKVSLGPTRLRTETAGLAAVVALNLLNQG
jgi:16S rRNA (uracil1498-N3)-methyltransferase